MVSHIICEAQRKGFEANIASLADGYEKEIVRLHDARRNIQKQHGQEVLRLQSQISQIREAKEVQPEVPQQTFDNPKAQHAGEIAALQASHQESITAIRSEADGELAECKRLGAVVQGGYDALFEEKTRQEALHAQETTLAPKAVEDREQEIARLQERIATLVQNHTQEIKSLQALKAERTRKAELSNATIAERGREVALLKAETERLVREHRNEAMCFENAATCLRKQQAAEVARLGGRAKELEVELSAAKAECEEAKQALQMTRQTNAAAQASNVTPEAMASLRQRLDKEKIKTAEMECGILEPHHPAWHRAPGKDGPSNCYGGQSKRGCGQGYGEAKRHRPDS